MFNAVNYRPNQERVKIDGYGYCKLLLTVI